MTALQLIDEVSAKGIFVDSRTIKEIFYILIEETGCRYKEAAAHFGLGQQKPKLVNPWLQEMAFFRLGQIAEGMEVPPLEKLGGNFYRPRRLISETGQPWQCAHGVSGEPPNQACLNCWQQLTESEKMDWHKSMS